MKDNVITLGSQETHTSECVISSKHSTLNAIELLGYLEVIKDLPPDKSFIVEDERAKSFLTDLNLITLVDNNTFNCTQEQLNKCSDAADIIASYVDMTIDEFHKEHPNGKIVQK